MPEPALRPQITLGQRRRHSSPISHLLKTPQRALGRLSCAGPQAGRPPDGISRHRVIAIEA